ncbi:site-2 protease family protein [Antrihabitans cavernicola]|uniref:Site-2 protease family protein n=1 Tax=Antrihabitans cavernicola TaxID=2495913 RepID=A0A5A7S3F6_9NOCA|nr:site-2 protease family protein [Spelaeibacter cavernicola]KAA0017065.1 site-2 protease family protein [Spelaeibacter cavernicola]
MAGRGVNRRPSPVFLAVVALAVAGSVIAWNADLHSVLAHVGVFVLVVFGWIVTLCLHEFAHAYTAWRAGDREVEIRGYLTLNPLKYSHPMLSIGLPILFIAIGGIGLPGGAVYVHSHLFDARTQRTISLAGPAVNAVSAVILLAVIANFGSDTQHEAFWYGLSFLAFLQITATVLNLLPVPGLDGFGALEPSLSPQTRHQLQQYAPYGLLAVMALLFVPALNTAFFGAIYWVFELSGVPDWWAGNGGFLTQFWR